MNGTGPRPIATLWEWQESAACRTADSSRFFSPSGERGEARRERERRARALCDTCPVREECARFALTIGEEHGIWGGTTSRERIAELRRPRGGRSRADIAAGVGRGRERDVIGSGEGRQVQQVQQGRHVRQVQRDQQVPQVLQVQQIPQVQQVHQARPVQRDDKAEVA